MDLSDFRKEPGKEKLFSMNTRGLPSAAPMAEVSTCDQYSLRKGRWAKCRQRAPSRPPSLPAGRAPTAKLSPRHAPPTLGTSEGGT